jgi:hypothetical protein
VNRVERRVKEEGIRPFLTDELNCLLADALRQILPILEDLFTIAPEIVEVRTLRLAPIVAMRVIIDAAFEKPVKIIEPCAFGTVSGVLPKCHLPMSPVE